MKLVRYAVSLSLLAHVIVISPIEKGGVASTESTSLLKEEAKPFNPFITCPPKKHRSKVVKACLVGGACILIGGAVAAGINELTTQTCSINLSDYPICGKREQNQMVIANYEGNIIPGTVFDDKNMIYYMYTYDDGYCDLPLLTICTHFNASRYKNLPSECQQFQDGKLLGVVTATPQFQKDFFLPSDCLDAPAKIERHFKRTKKKYCNVSPELVGFEKFKNMLLTLYLLEANATSEFVRDHRWGNPDNLGETYGPTGNCKATWSTNTDPSAQLHDAQKKQILYTQKFLNGTKLFERLNHKRVVQKNKKTKLGKTKNNR